MEFPFQNKKVNQKHAWVTMAAAILIGFSICFYVWKSIENISAGQKEIIKIDNGAKAEETPQYNSEYNPEEVLNSIALSQEDKIAFIKNSEIWIADGLGQNSHKLIWPRSEKQTVISSLDWSPDGSKLAFSIRYEYDAKKEQIIKQGRYIYYGNTNKIEYLDSDYSNYSKNFWSLDGKYYAQTNNDAITVFDTNAKEYIRVESFKQTSHESSQWDACGRFYYKRWGHEEDSIVMLNFENGESQRIITRNKKKNDGTIDFIFDERANRYYGEGGISNFTIDDENNIYWSSFVVFKNEINDEIGANGTADSIYKTNLASNEVSKVEIKNLDEYGSQINRFIEDGNASSVLSPERDKFYTHIPYPDSMGTYYVVDFKDMRKKSIDMNDARYVPLIISDEETPPMLVGPYFIEYVMGWYDNSRLLTESEGTFYTLNVNKNFEREIVSQDNFLAQIKYPHGKVAIRHQNILSSAECAISQTPKKEANFTLLNFWIERFNSTSPPTVQVFWEIAVKDVSEIDHIKILRGADSVEPPLTWQYFKIISPPEQIDSPVWKSSTSEFFISDEISWFNIRVCDKSGNCDTSYEPQKFLWI